MPQQPAWLLAPSPVSQKSQTMMTHFYFCSMDLLHKLIDPVCACVSVWCFGDVLYLGCCVPLICQCAVELLQEAGLSGVAGEKSKADWVGTRLMVDLCLCGGKTECAKSCMKGVVGIPAQGLHALSKNPNDSHTWASQTTSKQRQLQKERLIGQLWTHYNKFCTFPLLWWLNY